MLYREYEPETLKKLQQAEITILKDFDDLCSKNGVEYFVCGGTALGGIRHGGFIPWDDDIDLGMTRENYDKFLKIARTDRRYDYINPEVDIKFPVMITKWYRKGTLFLNEELQGLGFNLGIAIDIFCFDRVPNDEKCFRKQALTAWFFGKLMILRRISKPNLYYDGVKAKMIAACLWIMSSMMKILHISPRFLYNCANKAVQKYKNSATERVAYLFDPTPYTSVVRLDDIYPIVRRKFEGIELSYPCHVEKYLERRYGDDYMELPPENKRHNHAPKELVLGDLEV